MFQPRLRRVLAIFALTLTAALVTGPGASAAVHAPREREARVRSVQQAQGSWMRDMLLHLLEKAGVRIDPDGLW